MSRPIDLLFLPCSAMAGFLGYRALHRYIEVTSHTLGTFGPMFYVYSIGFLGLFLVSVWIAWRRWGGWSLLFVPLATFVTVVVLVKMFWLPFP